MKGKNWGRALAFIFPLLVGMMGFFYVDGQSFPDSLFSCVLLYTLGYENTPPNLWVEVARWTAPLATASGVFLAVGTLRRAAAAWVRYLRGDSVAVYGSPRERSLFLERLGKKGVDGQGKFVIARRYILVGSQEENFLFYRAHRKELEKREVFLKCASIPAQSVSGAHLRLFCPEDTAARLFWRQRGLYAVSAERRHHMKIVMVGFGRLGEELLVHGLQDNIFHPQQAMEYHIFGDGRAFQALHPSLGHIDDPVVFHSEPWYDGLELMEEAALVLVLPQPDQLALVQGLLRVTQREEIDVFAPEAFPLDLLEEGGRLRLFDWEREACAPELIFGDDLLRRAKGINLRYCHLHDGVEETVAEGERQWAALDGFTRYSNISAADYHEIRLEMLEAMGVSGEEALSPALLEPLSELEHIRWCRYHFLNNWRPGQPGNGKRKDAAKRIHRDLIPYKELEEEEKEKDRETIRLLLSLFPAREKAGVRPTRPASSSRVGPRNLR